MRDKYSITEESGFKQEDKGMFGVVADGIKKISFSKKNKSNIIAHITMMNIPPLAAKRDAAYEIALMILHDKVESTSSGELLVAYTDALKLLNISEKAHKEMINAIMKLGKRNFVDAHGVYLRLLSDMITAALFVLSSSSIICADEQTVIYLLGSSKSDDSKEMLSLFSKCECDLRKSIVDLYTKAERTADKEREKMRKNFTEEGRERYDIAFKEFLGKFEAS
jgi:hypothetical protein